MGYSPEFVCQFYYLRKVKFLLFRRQPRFNPIPAGVHEIQDTLGGGGGSKSMFDVQKWHISLECSYALLLESSKKSANLQKQNFFAESSYELKMLKNGKIKK